VPDARFAGPDIAFDTGWIGPFAKTAPDGLVMLTVHHYADGPASNPKVTLERLVQAGGQVAPKLATMDQLGRTYHPKSVSWRSAPVRQIAVIMRYEQGTRGFAGAPDG
jgi:hypothetical protein